jgi:fructose-1,6-bisphosphatase/inositol monophosphatase family enzyme
MPFDRVDAAELTRIARAVARAEVMPHFRALSADQISTKKDAHDIVTLADTAAEAALTAAFRAAFPDAAVVGEEAVSADPCVLDRLAGKGRVIVVDPIDGTWNYAAGQTNFGMILSVVEDGITIFGLHLDPVMDDWIFAHTGEGAHWERDGASHPIHTRSRGPLDQRLGIMSVALFPKAHQPRMALAGLDYGRILSPRCAAHEYRLVAEGHADFCLAGTLNPWDHAAGTLIVTEAGGHAALLDASPYSARIRSGTLLTAASREVWNEAAERFAFLDQP